MKTETQKAIDLLEKSFLAPLFTNQSITDISFNGEAIYYQSSTTGRQKATMTPTLEEVFQLLKQLANYMNHSFSYSQPILDISIGPYRMHAIGESITRKMYEKSISFSLRIHQQFDAEVLLFINQKSPWTKLLTYLIHHHYSVIISGITGVGKTQLQKELLTLMIEKTRVILIDNILELDGIRFEKLDLTIWQEKAIEKLPLLLAAALRSHPDWLVIAEARGNEFKEVFTSVVTGHPLITTLHCKDVKDSHLRMAMMMLQGEVEGINSLIGQLKHYFPCVIHLSKQAIDGTIIRSIESMLWIEDEVEILLKEEDIKQFMKNKQWAYDD